MPTHTLRYIESENFNHRHAGFNTPIVPQDENETRGVRRGRREKEKQLTKNIYKALENLSSLMKSVRVCVTIAVAVETYLNFRSAHIHSHEMQLPVA